ncbi:endolytic transglycosylase MltG [bacterium]|nr:endolytic transglycosylase MltG [bacterium]NBW56489.1 endolytic transglycosylase MltG [bacterium]NBX71540.1 endolytic transglycosylase MltG [bacterium]
MKRKIQFFFIKTLLLLSVCTLIFLYDWLHFWNTPITVDSSQKFVVHQGQSLSAIANNALASITLDRPSYFYWKMILTTESAQAGYYLIDTTTTPKQFLDKLTKGITELEKFTIQSSWTWHKLLLALNKNNHIKHTIKNDKDIQELAQSLDSSTLEGIFAADTYFFKPGITDQEILHLAAAEQKQRLANLYSDETFLQTPLSILTLASIIEREGDNIDDYKIISSVFHNRLKKGMYLQSDATVCYGLSDHPKKISLKELWVMHPHNTYRYPGLPPTPIAYPSQHAMIAAVYPASTDYLFFLTDRDGKLRCSKEFKEHVNAKKTM